jgi:3-phenylpropionate/trans-cinnamate dioxygenase alpha subunit
VWGWCVVDKAAPQEARDVTRRHVTQRHSASGTWEADDVDNWVHSTMASRGRIAQRYPQNIQMGLGHETTHPELPGTVGSFQCEINQRGFYRRWAELMEAA